MQSCQYLSINQFIKSLLQNPKDALNVLFWQTRAQPPTYALACLKGRSWLLGTQDRAIDDSLHSSTIGTNHETPSWLHLHCLHLPQVCSKPILSPQEICNCNIHPGNRAVTGATSAVDVYLQHPNGTSEYRLLPSTGWGGLSGRPARAPISILKWRAIISTILLVGSHRFSSTCSTWHIIWHVHCTTCHVSMQQQQWCQSSGTAPMWTPLMCCKAKIIALSQVWGLHFVRAVQR